MFGKLCAARLIAANFTTKAQKDNDDKRKLCVVTMAYDFSEDVATALGGAAPSLQKMLSNGNTEGMKVARAGVVLDVKDVGVKIKSADKDEIEVDHTLSLKAKAKQPTASSNSPTLEVVATFEEKDDETSLFLINHRGEMCKVRLDRKQLDLPATKEEDGKVEEN